MEEYLASRLQGNDDDTTPAETEPVTVAKKQKTRNTAPVANDTGHSKRVQELEAKVSEVFHKEDIVVLRPPLVFFTYFLHRSKPPDL